MAVLLETSIGDIVVDLMLEERPKACLNFLKLCKMKYYNYCLFHTVKGNFIAQSGDPTNTGDGGTSIWGMRDGDGQRFFAAEKVPRIKHTNLGCLSMVNDGKGRHSSQFFISLGTELDYLDAQEHTVFGAVSEGFDALQKLNEAYCDKAGRPYRDIRINHTVVLDDPFPDLDGLAIRSRSPSPTADQLKSSRVGADEELDNYKGMSLAEIDERIKEQETAAHTTVLEMVGDLPDADAKPPDNVLFVCKLNPATTSEDLETIFSRFGAIDSCEVIRDKKSGESLQYAFVEFERPEDCEDAYFKMDNVLIDERRIHVDFSQSVAKVQGKPQQGSAGKNKPEFRLKARERRGNDRYQMVFDDLDTAALVTSDDVTHSKDKRSRHNTTASSHSSASSRSTGDGQKGERHGFAESGRSSRWDSHDRQQQQQHSSSSNSGGGRSHAKSHDQPGGGRRSRSRSRSPHDSSSSGSRRKTLDHHRRHRDDRDDDRHSRPSTSERSSKSSGSHRDDRQRGDDRDRRGRDDKRYDSKRR